MSKKLTPGAIVTIKTGTHAGKGGQVRGAAHPKSGTVPVLVDGKIVRLKPEAFDLKGA